MLVPLNVRVADLLHKTAIKDCSVRRPIVPRMVFLLLFRSTVRFPEANIRKIIFLTYKKLNSLLVWSVNDM